jgi:hypothetical protein
MRAIRNVRIAAVALGTLVGACSSDSSVAPDKQPADLTQVLTEMTLPSLSSVMGSTSRLGGLPASIPAATVPSNCGYAASSGSFVCPAVSAGGLSFTRSFTLLDASGAAQSQFDPATTASVRMHTATSGTVASVGSTTTIDGTQDLTVSGLTTGVHVLDGTSTMHLTGSLGSGFASGPLPMDMAINMTISKLVLPSAASGSKYPTSGTVTLDETSPLGGPAQTLHMQMTFSTTGTVVVTITEGSFTSRCTVDLASGSAARCS